MWSIKIPKADRIRKSVKNSGMDFYLENDLFLLTFSTASSNHVSSALSVPKSRLLLILII